MRAAGLAARLILVVLALLGCDLGERATDWPHGPPLRLLSSSPRDGEGASCPIEDTSCGFPIDAPIRLRFNRVLLPSSVNREVIRVYTGTPSNPAPYLTPRYDVLAGELVFRFTRPLQRKALYQVELLDATSAGVGLKAFDGAALEASGGAIRWSFVTSGERQTLAVSPSVGREPTCDDVLRRLQPSCASGCCHGGSEPAMGLRLDAREALFQTAVGMVAHQTETGNTLGIPFENPVRFGTAMPLIHPGSVENSYLMYKLLLAPENLRPCESGCEEFMDASWADDCRPPSDAERIRLREWFVPGEPMPFRPASLAAECEGVSRFDPLDCQSVRVLSRWVEQGARCD